MKTYTALTITDHFAGFKGRTLAQPYTAVDGIDLEPVATGTAALVAEQLLPHMTPIERADLIIAALAMDRGTQRVMDTLTPADLGQMDVYLAGDSAVVPVGSERGSTMQMGG